LLDDSSFEPETVLAVSAPEGVTTIGPIDDAGREALKQHLYTPGELLRMNQLSPSPEAVHESDEAPSLFDHRE
jgi:hypothetical protein